MMYQNEPSFSGMDKCRTVMGLKLPTWQRPLVWTEEQNIRFLESLWLGLPVGTYSYNMVLDGGALDGLLIDGQQRLNAIQRYLEDAFPVFGHRWSEVTKVDQRLFKLTAFPSYCTQSSDEQYLRDYYNRMNFGGVAHTEEQRA
ncbi:DUF262 domain-containing protein [Salipiger mucosus]|nr:DUF262 domain-containing protein [Salipiger mucosus]